MKKYILLSTLTIGILVNAFGQKPTMELTFTAADNGLYVPLDSILIENLTKEVDTILYAPDTVLVLGYITGIGDNDAIEKNRLTVSQNYPNPFKVKTAFDLYLPEKGNITITGRDILGKELMHRAYALNRGNHSFAFYAGNESYYLITVTGKQTSRTIKMMNAGNKSSNGEKCKLVYTGNDMNESAYKSQDARNNFWIELGDELRYTGYAMTVDGIYGNAVIFDVPESSVDYEFAILKGFRCPDTPTVEDIDGNVYNTVQIGDQCWTVENLKTRAYTDGTPIPNLTDPDAWWLTEEGAYVWYDNDISWMETYGALYNWYTGIDPRGLCPTGWHVPNDDEWTELTGFIGGTDVPHGTELKSCRQVNSPWGDACNTSDHPRWDDSGNSIYGTDDYGFSLLPGGYRVGLGDFELLGGYGAWWTTTAYDAYFSWGRAMFWDTGHMGVFYDYKEVGRSIRCIKD